MSLSRPLKRLPPWKRILVRLPNWLGDLIMATPALRAVRQAFPGAFVVAALPEPLRDVLEGSPLVDALWPLARGRERGFWGALEEARRLRAGRFDGVLLLTNSFTSALPPALARIPYRVGLSGDGRSPLLTHRRRPLGKGRQRRPHPMPRYYQRILARVGIPSAGSAYELPARAEDREQASRILGELGWKPKHPLLLLNGGASFGPSKQWLPERLAEVARTLCRGRGWQPAVLCGPGEEAWAHKLALLIGGDVLDTSQQILDLKALRGALQLAALLITTDTGPRHMAAAFGKPVVVLMGPTHPRWTACNLERTQVVRHPVPCGPCHLKICPTNHACMEDLHQEAVLAAVERLLPRSGAPLAHSRNRGP